MFLTASVLRRNEKPHIRAVLAGSSDEPLNDASIDLQNQTSESSGPQST